MSDGMRMLVCAAVVCCALAGQTTRNVPSQFATIQAAITASSNGDTVLVAPGTHAGPITFAGKTIRVMSSGGAAVTLIAGPASGAAVTFAGGEGVATVFSGFTMNGGNGAILCQNASPQIQNCVISNQVKSGTATGAGIRCLSTGVSVASPSISGCVFTSNVAGGGGAISFEPQSSISSSPTITNCAFDGNYAWADSNFASSGGGAIRIAGASTLATIDGCTFTHNRSETAGCSILGRGFGVLNITNSRFLYNGAQSGSYGAFYVDGSQCNVTNCVIAFNTNGPAAGALTPTLGSGTTVFRCCTIYGNTGSVGGALYFNGGGISLTVDRSIVWGNSYADIVAVNSNLAFGSVTNSNVGTGVFTPSPTNLNVDPLFVDGPGGDFHLSRSSPCRNAGGSSLVGLPATDIDGSPRLIGPGVDIGADEVPLDVHPGTTDSLDLYVTVATGGDPLAASRAAAAGALLRVLLKSPTGSMAGALPVLGGQLHPTGAPPVINTPGIWLEATAFIITGALPGSPFSAPGLPPAGLPVAFQVPPGLGGWTLRLQGFTSSAFAANSVFAASEALEVTF